MSESNEVVVEETAPEYSDIEVEAISMGWKPKEQHGDKGYIEADEYVRRKPLFDKIDSYSKKVKLVEQSLKDLTTHHSKVRENEYARAYYALHKEYRVAMEEGDTLTALDAGDKLNELTQQRQAEIATTKPVVTGPSDDYSEWIVDNKWYENDSELHDFADAAALSYIKNHGQTADKIVFDHVEKAIKKAYPEKFGNPNRNRPGATGKGDVGNRGSNSSKRTLNHDEDAIARRWERMGVMSRDAYAKELQRMEDE